MALPIPAPEPGTRSFMATVAQMVGRYDQAPTESRQQSWKQAGYSGEGDKVTFGYRGVGQNLLRFTVTPSGRPPRDADHPVYDVAVEYQKSARSKPICIGLQNVPPRLLNVDFIMEEVLSFVTREM